MANGLSCFAFAATPVRELGDSMPPLLKEEGFECPVGEFERLGVEDTRPRLDVIRRSGKPPFCDIISIVVWYCQLWSEEFFEAIKSARIYQQFRYMHN